jgi:hypothetical protein
LEEGVVEEEETEEEKGLRAGCSMPLQLVLDDVD